MARNGGLGDLVLKIPRPNRKAAREIFHRHMPEEIPYACNGEGPAAARQAIIDSAVSQLYAANEDSEIANVTFRDGKRRVVRASEMINGAEIAGIAQAAIEQACVRESQKGPSGVELPDLLEGVSAFMEKSTRVLTPANCRNYLEDLPQDVDVVGWSRCGARYAIRTGTSIRWLNLCVTHIVTKIRRGCLNSVAQTSSWATSFSA